MYTSILWSWIPIVLDPYGPGRGQLSACSAHLYTHGPKIDLCVHMENKLMYTTITIVDYQFTTITIVDSQRVEWLISTFQRQRLQSLILNKLNA